MYMFDIDSALNASTRKVNAYISAKTMSASYSADLEAGEKSSCKFFEANLKSRRSILSLGKIRQKNLCSLIFRVKQFRIYINPLFLAHLLLYFHLPLTRANPKSDNNNYYFREKQKIQIRCVYCEMFLSTESKNERFREIKCSKQVNKRVFRILQTFLVAVSVGAF